LDKEIFIVRHGETDYNRKGIIQGSGIDSDLNELGRRQAAAFYNHYKNEGFELVITSNLVRTHQTAAPFIEAGIPHIIVPEIREISWGIYEGQPYSPEVGKEYKKLISAWAGKDLTLAMKGGESAEQLSQRLLVFMHQLKSLSEKKILVVSHGRTIRCMMCLFNQLPMKEMEQFPHANTGLFVVRMQAEKNVVKYVNDIRHLESLSISI
jgi:broad specificity phosphatase PhoE